METLRRAIADNREVFVNIINKNTEDARASQDNLVEDLEKVSSSSNVSSHQQSDLEKEIKQQKQKFKSLEEVKLANDSIHHEYVL